MEVARRFFKQPASSFFLFGPRGTGKSTLVRQLFPDALWIDLLQPDVYRAYRARPERLREVVAASPGARTVVIDEIQKVPELLDAVHALIEGRRELHFVLTGSSARKLKRAGVDLLAGRALRKTLHPFLASELGPSFQLESALELGLLPLVHGSPEPAAVLDAYAALYLKEEVQMEGLVRNVGDFSRFLEVISFSHASVLNVSNVSRECGVERRTVAGYVDILVDLLLAFRLEVFTRRARRATSVHPKLYLFDAGVYRSLRPRGPLDLPEEIDGAALEGLVAQHLRAWNAYRDERNGLYFWRTRSGAEVDFVVHGPDGFWAIEVKNGASIHPEDLRALKAFRADYPECRALLLHRGTERTMRDEILCVPSGEFLSRLDPSRLLDAGL